MAEVSFDEIIQEGRRKKAAEKLAQEIFGKGRRSSAPASGAKNNLGGSLASRVGVNKRTPSLPRSTTPRQNQRPSGTTRPAPAQRPSYTHPLADGNPESKSNANPNEEADDGGSGLNIKGAASGPYLVIAQNFMPGTTAADIESVMLSVGGQMTSCRLVASNPTVIAEMAFVEKSGAEQVIDTFNNKKADGRVLYVYWKSGGGGLTRNHNTSRRPQPEPQTSFGAGQNQAAAMEVDENAEAREAENRLREERRGREDRAERDVFPTGPRRQYRPEMDDYYDQRPRQHYQDGRYGFGGGYREGGRPRYGEESRRGRGQSWRP